MTVRRDRVCQSDFSHDDEARAIGEREILVVVLKKQVTCLFESLAVDSLPAEPGALINLLPQPLRSGQTEAESNEGERFIDDEVGRDQRMSSVECRITSRATSKVSGVGAVGAG